LNLISLGIKKQETYIAQIVDRLKENITSTQYLKLKSKPKCLWNFLNEITGLGRNKNN